ncbi:gliding motility-associated C-terminal domain-containing protein [Larkinella terrae]|uniref:T9SS type B sorting domain-containing protein n=1 Tax=Larkinella terrae TaxID=2025311 RepID=A0A7K0ELV9_9BACT|nr:gliding motility-associated C-terminal domain-containing protein [Larkinella terrae]MRS62785.1 T9SS type B sorting domain-containing protein [Larkinella terrae]
MNVLLLRIRLLLMLALLFGVTKGFGQQLDCANIGFEEGTTRGWILSNGVVTDVNQKVEYQSEVLGSFQNGHLITSSGNDPLITSEVIPMVAPGSNYSIRIGNVTRGGRFDRIKGSFVVTPDNTLFQYKFAVILDNPAHQVWQQPEFMIRITTQDGSTIGCSFYNVTSAGTIDGFKNQGTIRYRNWTTGAVNLQSYVGQTITVEVTAHGCTEMRHVGYAYFDAQCLKAEITTALYCPLIDPKMVLKAPEGFATYVWSTGETTPTIAINPVQGAKYWVKVKPFSSLNETCEFQLNHTVSFEPQKEPVPVTASICEGDGYVVADSTYRKAGTYLTRIKRGENVCDSLVKTILSVRPLARSSQTVTICEGESYTVGTTVYKTAGSYETRIERPKPLCDSIVTTNLSIKSIEFLVSSDTIIRPNASAQLRATVSSAGNYKYQWSPSEGLACPTCAVTTAKPSETTRYTLIVEDLEFHCQKTASVEVTIGDCTIHTPTAFTPNKDGNNDVFLILGTDCVTEVKEFLIYNRWSEVIFRKQNFPASDPAYGWNGEYLGETSESGIYTYKIKVAYINGKLDERRGTVMLIH